MAADSGKYASATATHTAEEGVKMFLLVMFTSSPRIVNELAFAA
jgi:hypothetical protein